MLRRLATLFVLLASLAGVIPAVTACTELMRGDDCCPPGQPCDTGKVPTAAIEASCCLTQPVPTRSAISASPAGEGRLADFPQPDTPAAPAFAPANAFASVFTRTDRDASSPPWVDPRQIYLRTGRLRL